MTVNQLPSYSVSTLSEERLARQSHTFLRLLRRPDSVGLLAMTEKDFAHNDRGERTQTLWSFVWRHNRSLTGEGRFASLVDTHCLQTKPILFLKIFQHLKMVSNFVANKDWLKELESLG
jgi:hypothetical protein